MFSDMLNDEGFEMRALRDVAPHVSCQSQSAKKALVLQAQCDDQPYMMVESFARAESNRRVELVRAADRDAAHETQPAKSEVMWIPYGPAEEELCVEIAADIGAAAAGTRPFAVELA